MAAPSKYPGIARHARTLKCSRQHLRGTLEGKFPDPSGLCRRYFDLAEKERAASDTPEKRNLEWARALNRDAAEKIKALRRALKKLRANPNDFASGDLAEVRAREINGAIESLAEAFEIFACPTNPLPSPAPDQTAPLVEISELSAAKNETQKAQ